MADIRRAKAQNKLGIVLHFKGLDAIEDALDLIGAFYGLGVKVMQLTYNVRNRIGDGCAEPSDAGLSQFGKSAIRRMNELGIIVDCSHTGFKTTMDAIQESSCPVILSHANAYGIHPSNRNASDDLITAIGENGGVVGVVGYAPFVGSKHQPELDDLIAHIDYHAELIGPQNVVLGLDYYIGQHPIASIEKASEIYANNIKVGRWSKESYPPPPWYYPREIETPAKMPNLTNRLIEHGYSEREVEEIWVAIGSVYMKIFGMIRAGVII